MTTRHRRGITAIGLIILAVVLAAVMTMAVLIYKMATSSYNVPGQYKYDLSAHEKTDPKLVLFRLEKVIDLKAVAGQEAPTTLALGPDGRMYVGLKNLLVICDANGRSQRVLPTGLTPTALHVTADGGGLYLGAGPNLYMLHPENWGVEPAVAADPTTASAPTTEPMAEPAVAPVPLYTLGKNAYVTGIAEIGRRLFVADSAGRVVHRLDIMGRLLADGSLDHAAGKIDGKDRGKAEDSDAKGFVIPSPYFALAVAPDGLLRVVNPGRHRVETYTLEGDLEGSWGRQGVDIEGFSGCCNPVSIAIFPDGRFVTAEKGLIRVKLYSPEGRFMGVVAGPEDFVANHADAFQVCETTGEKCATGGLAVAATADGKVLVLDPAGRAVRVYAPKGTTSKPASKPVQ